MFLQCSSFERASRSLAETGFLFDLFGIFFVSVFEVVFRMVLEGSFCPLGSILSPF